ncbi:hypothetical protein PHYSODRAFT_262654 [Phytophthora sojae]|uniref:Tyrosinase copper-binding domain-containing protein n=1 Tax=Phytophthora sojae (strain P6497) TaxID=1094619 RepID=G5AB96_PHYSP|nr:hypothetical protein PHYSODRAFT_262654 [Phytophthora sojae]EGZ07241.1 hypothetical protein PHYSODRAFT_262654 [Phytophthora sojae]|eukprot:XP_009536807.1 hypothetical protein PHYSODRAFT_262654 [Phytophthora sojae]
MGNSMKSYATGPQFACVTVPYFNWIVAAARVTAGTCSLFADCMAITKELGGSATGAEVTLNINGEENFGRCVAEPPLNHFCQLSSLNGTACLPRSDWSQAPIPSSTTYASVRQQVFKGKNIGQMSPLVEQGCHDNVHANLDGTMGTFASPAEPLFWSHHAMIDLLHTIFHKKRRTKLRERPVLVVAVASSVRRMASPCTGERGVNPIPGSTDPKIGKYFAGVPNQFAGLMDVRDLGNSSYTYSITGQLAAMYDRCDASPTSRKLEEDTTATNTTSKPNNFPETDYNGQDDGRQDVIVVDSTGKPVEANAPIDAYVSDEDEKRVINWYDQTMDAMRGDSHDNMADLERQACMFEHVCLGGTKDYSPEFKALWKVTEPRCKTIVDAILNGSESIIYESWREDMEAQFGCPKPNNATNSSSYSGSWGSSQDGYPVVGSQESNDVIQLPDDAVQSGVEATYRPMA